MFKQEAIPSNAELLQRCRAGDAAAWQMVVRRYGRLVHSIPVRYGFSRSEAEDVGQEVFFALAQQLERIEEPERLGGWLLTTTRRVSWRIMQQRRLEQPDAIADLSENDSIDGKLLGVAVNPSYADLVSGWERQEALQAGLARLNRRCRDLLVMIFLDDDEPSYEQISARLAMPKGSIGPTRNRCLAHLREILQGLGFTDFD
jgi:RNA polymerase sigma factor (sigma-70 family)